MSAQELEGHASQLARATGHPGYTTGGARQVVRRRQSPSRVRTPACPISSARATPRRQRAGFGPAAAPHMQPPGEIGAEGEEGKRVRGRDDYRDNPANPGAGVSRRGGGKDEREVQSRSCSLGRWELVGITPEVEGSSTPVL
ncbi:hypothetical protein IMZ48_30205 [Candidatus Bathyarchaeota archaeon]|nr:hypothetical protein [Candidatus Bathyarchaeota archaeon]